MIPSPTALARAIDRASRSRDVRVRFDAAIAEVAINTRHRAHGPEIFGLPVRVRRAMVLDVLCLHCGRTVESVAGRVQPHGDAQGECPGGAR